MSTLNVILKQDVKDLGFEGQEVRVRSGYYRNFLSPRQLAVAATAANKKWVEVQRVKSERRFMEEKELAEVRAKELAELEVVLKLKSGDNDRLFGSVSNKDIAAQLKELGHDIDRRKITVDTPIKQLGLFSIPIRLHQDVDVKINVLIEKLD